MTPNRPAWSKPPLVEPEPGPPPARGPERGLGAKVQAWCYLCNSGHVFDEPHINEQTAIRRKANRQAMVMCGYCGEYWEPSVYDNRRMYCTNTCRVKAKNLRRAENRKDLK